MAGYLCSRCWVRFPEEELVIVREARRVRGFRCAKCQQEAPLPEAPTPKEAN